MISDETTENVYSGAVVPVPAEKSLVFSATVHPAEDRASRSTAVPYRVFVSSGAGTNDHAPVRWLNIVSNSTPNSDEPLWKTYLQKRLSDLSSNVGNPGYPSLESLTKAWHVTTGLIPYESPTPSVVPGEDDTVDLVWQRSGWVVEVEVGPSSAWMWAKDRHTGETISGDIDDLPDMLRDLLLNIAD